MLLATVALLVAVNFALAAPPPAQATYCSEDNLLRAFQHTSTSAAAYCSTATGYPAFLAATSYPATRLSSACSCFSRFPTEGSLPTPTSTTSTATLPAVCSNVAAAPVSYQNAGTLSIAGVGGSVTVSAASAQECCAKCQLNSVCFAFAYGNYDPTINAPAPVTAGNLCYNYVFVNTALGCFFYGVYLGSAGGSAPSGGSTSFGYGPCQVNTF